MRRPNWEAFKPIRRRDERRNMGPVLKVFMYLGSFVVGAVAGVAMILLFLDHGTLVPILPGSLIYVSATRLLVVAGLVGGILGMFGLWKVLREADANPSSDR